MSVLVVAILFVCCTFCFSLSKSGDTEDPSTEDSGSAVAGCESSLSSQLTFVTSLSIRGCPVFVHRLGEVKVGRFALEPIFCITDSDALRQPSIHFDPLMNIYYYSFPVKVTEEQILADVESQLRHLLPKSIAFLEVTSIRVNYTQSIAFKDVTFLWDPTETVGHLRFVCDGFACQSVGLYLPRGQTEIFDNIRLKATLQSSDGCGAVMTGAYPATIANAPLIAMKALQRDRSVPLRQCSGLRLFRVLQIGNCTAYVYQRRGKRGHFLMEPLLCPSDSFSQLIDYSLGRHYLKLQVILEDSAMVQKVKSRLESVSPQSVEFMKLWDASIHVMDRLAEWQIEPLRLSTDRKAAELRAYCLTQALCELLSTTLKTEPVNFWKNIQWTGTSLYSDECMFTSDKRRFVFRMKEAGSGAAKLQTRGRWSSEDLRGRIVTRNGRDFIIVNQRGCGTSNFQRNWAEYVEGFGDNRNFWLGLRIINGLTSPQETTMRVEIQLWNDTEWFAEYSGFSVGNSATNYALNYTEMVRARSSLVFDALAASRGPFSTRDVDNYRYHSAGYCSSSWGGHSGWWFFGTCAYANPNGVYVNSDTSDSSYSVWRFAEGFKALREYRMLLQI